MRTTQGLDKMIMKMPQVKMCLRKLNTTVENIRHLHWSKTALIAGALHGRKIDPKTL